MLAFQKDICNVLNGHRSTLVKITVQDKTTGKARFANTKYNAFLLTPHAYMSYCSQLFETLVRNFFIDVIFYT
jgi:hypothetical protein